MTGSILVCGGAGYIGSHMVRVLQEMGHQVVVFDDFSTGHRAAIGDAQLVTGNLLNSVDLDHAFSAHAIDAVMHFAAKALVGESVREPLDYYDNNVVGTLRLLQSMRRHSVNKLIFSSTCATYGNPQSEKIDESHAQQPINAYGASKLMCERMLADAAMAHGISSVALRYFNAAGAALDGSLGESHDPETHLIPNAIRAALGSGPRLQVMGDDYPTKDGTCVRDYVHVLDLADAHARALKWLTENPGAHAFNLGTEHGDSVMDVIRAVESVSRRTVPRTMVARREGDPAYLVAESRKAREQLGWHPTQSDIRQLVATAWAWHQAPRY